MADDLKQRLRKIESTGAVMQGHINTFDDALTEIVRLQDELSAEVAHAYRLAEELRFYADQGFDGYDVTITDYGLSIECGEIIKDGGEKAIAALAAHDARRKS